MPRGDGTGPMGQGVMSGRARGCCAGFAAPGLTRRAGFGFCFGAGGQYVSEKDILTGQAEFLEKQLELVKERLSQLRNDK